MKTKNASKKRTARSASPLINEGEFKLIPIDKIELSPLNYRKYYSEADLNEFAKELSLHGIISPLTVRIVEGRYELVVGERRFRAAQIAKLKEVPARICNLSDEDVIEIQLCENLQREDPHPMHEAQAIGQMQQAKKSIDEISARLGKSKAFVYGRLKLLSLVEQFQEMFLVDKITIVDALQIATLSAESQQDFFDKQCKAWKKEKNFRLYNLEHNLSMYKYDLSEAPFNTKDKTLVPEAGACTRCAYNTATLKTLFPEEANEAVCTNKECYHKKCAVHLMNQLRAAFAEDQPQALIFNGTPSEQIKQALCEVQGALELPVYNRWDITVYTAPEEPSKEDYSDEEEGLYEDDYNAAFEEYKTDLEEYKQLLQSGTLKHGLYISSDKVEFVAFNERQDVQARPKQSAKDVQEALKNKTATPELLQAEIERLREKEERSKQLDRDKMQLSVRDELSKALQNGFENCAVTAEDLIAARLIIYQSLDYVSRTEVDKVLFTDKEDNQTTHGLFATLSDAQFAYLVRKALVGKSDSQYPHNVTGYFLYQLATSAGVDVKGIEADQQEKAEERQDRMEQRIKELQRKVKGLKIVKEFQESEV